MTKNLKTTTIRIIGPRASGKTTYLATLAYLPHKKDLQREIPGIQVAWDEGSDAEKLAIMAEDIIKKGAKLGGTKIEENANNIPYYYFRVKIPNFQGLPSTEIELSVRDFSGEFFQHILLEHKYNYVRPYIEDLFVAQSWMVMLTDWQPGQDTQLYLPAFKKLYQEISDKEQIKPVIKKLRIAVVMSKCERGEIWPGRLEPDEDLFKVRLPKTYNFLAEKFLHSTNRLKFFACSAFGVLSDRKYDFDPRPNRYIPDDGSPADYNAFLRSPSQWHPFGLISPLYWLSTGKTLHDPRL